MSGDDTGARPGPPGKASPAIPPTVPEDLVVLLDVLTDTIVEVLGFGVAGISLVRADGMLETMSVAGDANARQALLGKVEAPEMWDEILSLSEPRGRLWFLDHRSVAGRPHPFTWLPDLEPIEADDAWYPEDSLFAPLAARDGVRLGVLGVSMPRDGRRPRAETLQALEAFVISAALAIEHSSLRARAESSELRYRTLARQDPLTGVATRSLFFERIAALSRNRDASVAVLFVDLDGFKSINDEYSHRAGDQVLQVVARRLQACVRDEDTVIRWGGDEFAVVIGRTLSHEAADAVAARVSTAIQAPIAYGGRDLSVSASVGVAFSTTGDALDPEGLIHRADLAMYQVKQGRRP